TNLFSPTDIAGSASGAIWMSLTMPSRLRRAPAPSSQRSRYSYRAGPPGGKNLSKSGPASIHDFPSHESENFAPLPSTSSRPPTRTYGLRIIQRTVPVLPSSAVSSPPLARTPSTAPVPFFQRFLEKSGRYSQCPLQIVSGYLGL